MNPYRLDDRPTVINFSGGRSSAYMLRHILDAHDGVLPSNAVVCFANTGKERPETLDFIERCSIEWNQPIQWLEYRYYPDRKGGRKAPKSAHVVVEHATASRTGEPFDDLIFKTRTLPTPVQRVCTAELKVETIRRFVQRDLGWIGRVSNVLGIRYDEPRRWKKALLEECTTTYPMVDARVSKADVDTFWRQQPFDLAIPSALGNCDLCFLKGMGKITAALRTDPTLADWWIAHEDANAERAAARNLKNMDKARFNDGWSYRELRAAALASPELPGIDTFVGAPGAETDFDCFCGE